MNVFRTDYPLTPSFDLVRQSVQLLRNNIWPVFYLMFLPSLIFVVGTVLLGDLLQPDGTLNWNNRAAAGVGLVALGGLITLFTAPAALIMQVRAAKGEQPQAAECLRQGLRYILPLIGTIILIELAVAAGLLALVVPGLILLRSFYLAQFYVVDQKLGPIKALKKARAESRPNAGFIWGTIGVLLLFSLASSMVSNLPVVGYILSLGIGLLYAFAPAIRYNEIKNLKLETEIHSDR